MIYKNSKNIDIKLWLGIFLFAATIVFPNLGQTVCRMRICAVYSNSNSSPGCGCCLTKTTLIAEKHTDTAKSSCCGTKSTSSSEQKRSSDKPVNICSCTDLFQYVSVNAQSFKGFPTSEFCNLSDNLIFKGITERICRNYDIEDWVAFSDPPIFLKNCAFLC